MTKTFKTLCVLFIFLFATSSAYALWPVVFAGALARVATSNLSNQIGAGLLGVGLAALIGQKVGVLSVSSDTGEELRIPLSDLPQDRPAINPQLPASKAYDHPPTLPVGLSCPATMTSSSDNGYCLYTGRTTFTLNAQGGCDRVDTATYTQSSYNYGTCTQQNTSTTSINYIAPTQTCASNYTKSGSTCTLNAGVNPCSTGYSSSGSSCALTAPKAIPDSKIDVGTIGGKFQTPTDDADYSASVPYGATVTPDYVKLSVTPVNSDGSPYASSGDVKVAVEAPTAAGGYSGSCPYAVCIPVPNLPGHYRISGLSNTSSGAGQASYIDVNKDTGIVTNAGVVPLNGTIAGAGTTYTNTAGQVVTVPAGGAVLVNQTGAGVSQIAPTATNAAPSVTIDTSNLAKVGEAAAAAKTITDKLELTGDDSNLTEPSISNPLINYFNPLRSWIPPQYAGQCPSGSFEVFGTVHNFNAMCVLFDNNLTIIQGATSVISAFLAVLIVLGA